MAAVIEAICPSWVRELSGVMAFSFRRLLSSSTIHASGISRAPQASGSAARDLRQAPSRRCAHATARMYKSQLAL
jgi:hypothetical protein